MVYMLLSGESHDNWSPNFI